MLKPKGKLRLLLSFILLITFCLLLSSPALSRGADNSQLVMQVIEGRFHKWLETSEEGELVIYLLEPQEKMLTHSEVDALLTASRQWQRQNQHTLDLSRQLATEPLIYESLEQQYTSTLMPSITREIELQAMVDNRTAVSGSKAVTYPYNNSGFLKIDFNNEYMRGSAFLISPHVALTNAHNVYSKDLGGWFNGIEFSPAQYETVWPNAVKPYGTLSPILAETNEQYLFHESNNNRDQSIKHDYAALFFNESFNGLNTFVPLAFDVIPDALNVIGYPGIVRDANSMGMWEAKGSLISYDTHCLYYDAYTSGGSSGSPVLVYNQQAATYRVVGIHSFASPGNFSGGPHFNSLNQETIEKWLTWNPQQITNPVTALNLNKTNLTLKVGGAEALLVTISPQDADNNELSWSSNNRNIVIVDANGIVSAIAPGQALITVSTIDGSISATCTVTVTNGEQDVSQTPYPVGDLNGDGLINVQDVTLLMQHILMITPLDDAILPLADINDDGSINVVDVTLLMQYTLGLITTF